MSPPFNRNAGLSAIAVPGARAAFPDCLGLNEGLIRRSRQLAVTAKMPRILVAASRESTDTVGALLEGFAQPHFVYTVQEALDRLDEGAVDAIVAGLHFDDSLMPALLEAVKRNPATRHIPFHCCRFQPTRLNPAFLAAVRRACTELSSLDFIDLPEWREQLGAEGAAQRFRSVIARQLQR
jgi:hypothetical protein